MSTAYDKKARQSSTALSELSGSQSYRRQWAMLAGVTVGVGIASGFAGMGLGLLLRLLQHVAFGYSMHTLKSGESFTQGVTAASDLRRFLVLCLCGAVAGVGWWLLFRFGKPLVSIAQAVRENGPRMPFLATMIHAVLQIVTVALGSPLGREVAPRELAADFATWLSARAGLDPRYTRIMIACGAGAGLAAVYDVPLGGTLFTLEVLLATFEVSALIPALTTSVIATAVAWIGLGNSPQYLVPPLAISASLTTWSIVIAPAFGLAAYLFVQATKTARANAPKDWRLLAWCAVVFPMIGLLAFRFPQLLGNGKGLAQAGFENDIGLKLAATLLLLRLAVIAGALRAGAAGGLLTPGLSIGGLLGIVLGSLWNYAWPTGSLAPFAIVGGAAFLACSMKMPLTAIVLTLEFTRVGHDFLVPISLAVAGSFTVFHLCTQRTLFVRAVTVKRAEVSVHAVPVEALD
ncbi:MAG: chloride channel protein [Verrucomicrobia bacterium]|nr:chloride channel protein [Verrucomicrobiota bacterium]